MRWLEWRADRWVQLTARRCADGQPLPAQVHEEIERELRRLEFVDEQIAAVEKRRAAALAAAPAEDDNASRVKALLRLRGFGPEFSNMLVREVYYRQFANRRKVASYVGLSPSPFRSGGTDHEQGTQIRKWSAAPHVQREWRGTRTQSQRKL